MVIMGMAMSTAPARTPSTEPPADSVRCSL